MRNRARFQVTLNIPPGVDLGGMAEYIEAAVGSWRGGMDPENPITDGELDVVVRWVENGIQQREPKS